MTHRASHRSLRARWILFATLSLPACRSESNASVAHEPQLPGEPRLPGAAEPADPEAAAEPDATTGEHWTVKWDKNHDGMIAFDELPPMVSKHLAEADLDGDEKLTAAELEAFKARRRTTKDLDGDGEISDREAAAARAAQRRKRFGDVDANHDGILEQTEVVPSIWNTVGMADADADGRVTRDEFEAANASGAFERGRGGPRPR